ncbi:MAG: IS21-like element helper ATPase IstB [Acidobacteria bacterium]|nr:IS21-like element helper ATPase IstB [Acidobacteriota bacterium]
MLTQPTLQLLRTLKLSGMAQAFQQQMEQPQWHQLPFEERFSSLVEAEQTYRSDARLQRLLKQAHFKQSACVEDLDWRSSRGLDQTFLRSLLTCEWLRQHHDLLITGASGTGKSWIAQALGHAACRQGFTVRYERLHRLLEQLRIAHGDGSYHKRLAQLGRIELLILDDFALKPLAPSERHDLLELIEERHLSRSTILTSQLPVSGYYEYLQDPTIADALMDRLLHNAYRLELKGGSLRKKDQLR